MINRNILQRLSFSKGVNLLLEEGYVAEECIEKEDDSR